MIDIRVRKILGSLEIKTDMVTSGCGITVFFGHSGAGKTSIINMIAGLLEPDEGHIKINGKEIYNSETGINIPPEKRGVGYIFQDKRLFSFLSVRGNLLFGCTKSNYIARFDEIIQLLGISHLLERKPHLLSGGEAQRVAIGRALLSTPEVLLMDEPLSFLDQERKDELISYIKLIPARFGIPVILVTHSPREAELLADHVMLMENGKAVSAGNPKMMYGQKRYPVNLSLVN